MAQSGLQTAQNPQTFSASNSQFGEVNRLIAANRIHIDKGSLFIDPYLVVHPRELRPENEGVLRDKLRLTFGLNNPSFYESSERLPIALNLASLLPISLDAKRSSLVKEINKFNLEAKTGIDQDLAQAAQNRAAPFASIYRETIGKPEQDPAGMEMLKDGVSFYLLLREALTRKGHLNRLTDYIEHGGTPDQILTSLQDKLGVESETIIEAARTGGISGVADALGLDAAYVREVSAVVERASQQEFSFNTIEHWHMGRQLLRHKPEASVNDKITIGLERRIHDTIAQLKAKAHGKTDVAPSIMEKEQWVADGLKLLPPIQRQLLWDLRYEIGYTDNITADKIAFHPRIYGLHRQTKNELTDIDGTYRIYFSGKGDQEGSRRTLVHEVTHNLWPGEFSEQAVKDIDALANRDRMRMKSITKVLETQFDQFKSFTDAYHKTAQTPEQKQAVLREANQFFGSTLGDISALITENKDAYEVLHMTEHCNDRLHIDGKLFKQSGYNEPESRFREVLSRYAEMRYVRLREQPALMNFIAPGLTQIYDNHYLPHLERLHEKLIASRNVAANNNNKIAADNAQILPESKILAANNDNIKVSAIAPETAPETAIDNDNVAPTSAAQASTSDTPSNTVHTKGLILGDRQVAALQNLENMGVHVSKLMQGKGADSLHSLA